MVLGAQGVLEEAGRRKMLDRHWLAKIMWKYG